MGRPAAPLMLSDGSLLLAMTMQTLSIGLKEHLRYKWKI